MSDSDTLEIENATIAVVCRLLEASGLDLASCCRVSGIVWLSTLALIASKTGMSYEAIGKDLGILDEGGRPNADADTPADDE